MILKGPNWRVLGAEDDEIFIDIESTSCTLYNFAIKFYDSRRSGNTRSNRKSPKYPVNNLINSLIMSIKR